MIVNVNYIIPKKAIKYLNQKKTICMAIDTRMGELTPSDLVM